MLRRCRVASPTGKLSEFRASVDEPLPDARATNSIQVRFVSVNDFRRTPIPVLFAAVLVRTA